MKINLQTALFCFRKKLLINLMRTFIFLFFSMTFGLSPNNVISQNSKIKIDSEKTLTVDQVFDLIMEQTDYKFIYQEGIFDNFPKVQVKKGIISTERLLKKSLSSSNFEIVVNKDNTVLVKEEVLITEVQQQFQINGTITDSNSQPLAGANVIEKGTSNGTQTDFDGNFSLSVSNPNAILVISYLGFVTQEVAVANQTTINVVLQEDTANLDEVIVIGYGSVKKSDLTGSVSSISSKEFNTGPITNTDQLFQGKAAGVIIGQNSAQPGGTTTVTIRGNTSLLSSNQPLYVIDGMPIINASTSGTSDEGVVFQTPPGNPLNTINPNDIESIQILKDASATAIYGSRGANGVIIITTKKGKGRLSVNYNTILSTQSVAKEYDVLNAFDYATLFNRYYDYRASIDPNDPAINDPNVNKYTNAELQAFQNGQSTDWFNVLTRTGIINSHQLSLSSGSDTGSIYSSINYHKHEGVIQGSDTRRFSARLNATQKLGKAIEFGTNINISNVFSNIAPIGSEFGNRGGAISGALNWAPTIPVLDADGTLADFPIPGTNINPFGISFTDNNTEDDRIFANTYIEAEIFDNFKAKVTYGFDKVLTKTRNYVPSTSESILAPKGAAEVGTFQIDTRLIDLLLSYENEFGDHALNAVGGISKQVSGFESLRSRASGFSTDALSYNSLQTADNKETFTSKGESTLISFLGRVNYSYKDRYLLTFSGRYDGSSKFDVDSKWGFFPSAALAWKVINEPFMEKQNLFSDFKFRVGYGEVGNQEIPNNSSQPLIGPAGVHSVIGNTEVNPFAPSSPGSPGLAWERTKQLNIGLDFGLFNQRLNVTLDYYNIVTTDLLQDFTIPATSGFTSVRLNSGEILNKGFEISINSLNITSPNFEWSTNFNISFNDNTWKDRAGLPFGIEQEFGPVGGLYGYVADGLWQTTDNLNLFGIAAVPGTVKFKDINGRDTNGELTGEPDGAITDADRTLLGNSQPGISAGFTNAFRYKNFSLSMFFNGQFDYSIYNVGLERFNDVGRILAYGGLHPRTANFWTPTNTNTDVPNGLPNNMGSSFNSRNIEKGDFIRLKTLSLSYKVPVNNIDWLNSLTIGLNADNLFIITDYTGLDPETAIPAFTRAFGRGDLDPYPNSRTYSFTLNLSF